MHRQGVAARPQIVDRGAIVGIAATERPVRHHRALRTAQRPAQIVAVVVRVRRQVIEIHPRRGIEREGVGVALARHRDRLALRLAEHQRQRLVLDRVHAHAVGLHGGLVVARFEQQRVLAVEGERQRAHILARGAVEARRSEHGTPERIEQPPARITTTARHDVEEDLLPGHRREAVRVGLGCRIETATDRGV